MTKSPAASSRRNHKIQKSGGFTLAETLIALLSGMLLMAGSSFALRTMSTAITQSSEKANTRQNAVNGLKLLRSEVERSMNLLIYGATPSHLPDTNLASHEWSGTGEITKPSDGVVTYCTSLADNKKIAFNPVFGIKMAELSNPIVYGLSLGNGTSAAGIPGYSLMRCGLPLNEIGKYDTDSTPYLSVVLDNVAAIPCLKDDATTCSSPKITDPISGVERDKTTNEILSGLNMSFSPTDHSVNEPDVYTDFRDFMEPAIRFKTDASRKVLRFEDPTISIKDPVNSANNYDPDNTLDMSFLATSNSSQKVYFTAFARADKRLVRETINGLTLNGIYFNAPIGNTVRFIVDASGSMKTCMVLARNGRCKRTRMGSVKSELVQILTDLKNVAPSTKVGITFFSHRGGLNHKHWSFDENNNNTSDYLVTIGASGALQSAEQMIESITPSGWTEPWDGLDESFEDINTGTTFLLSDGIPEFYRTDWTQQTDRRSTYPDLFAAWDIQSEVCSTWYGAPVIRDGWRFKLTEYQSCTTQDTTDYFNYEKTANYYIEKNISRPTSKKLKIHTVTIDLESNWMQQLSEGTGGTHNSVKASDVQS